MGEIFDFLGKAIKPFREFIIENYGNPILWIGIFIGGLILFNIVYNALSKE